MEEVISRTMYCKHCNATDNPKPGQLFVVWGSTRQLLVIKRVHQVIRQGYTPHIIVFENPYTITEQGILITVSCGVDGCGISILNARPDGSYDIRFNRTDKIYLPPNDFMALIQDWKQSGFELI